MEHPCLLMLSILWMWGNTLWPGVSATRPSFVETACFDDIMTVGQYCRDGEEVMKIKEAFYGRRNLITCPNYPLQRRGGAKTVKACFYDNKITGYNPSVQYSDEGITITCTDDLVFNIQSAQKARAKGACVPYQPKKGRTRYLNRPCTEDITIELREACNQNTCFLSDTWFSNFTHCFGTPTYFQANYDCAPVAALPDACPDAIRSAAEKEYISLQCDNKYTCNITSRTALFGNPCPYYHKYTEVTYSCLTPPEYRIIKHIEDGNETALWDELVTQGKLSPRTDADEPDVLLERLQDSMQGGDDLTTEDITGATEIYKLDYAKKTLNRTRQQALASLNSNDPDDLFRLLSAPSEEGPPLVGSVPDKMKNDFLQKVNASRDKDNNLNPDVFCKLVNELARDKAVNDVDDALKSDPSNDDAVYITTFGEYQPQGENSENYRLPQGLTNGTRITIHGNVDLDPTSFQVVISNAQIGQDKREESKFNFRMTPIHDIQMTKASPFFVLLPALTFNNPLKLGDYFKLDIDLTIDLDNEHMYIYKVIIDDAQPIVFEAFEPQHPEEQFLSFKGSFAVVNYTFAYPTEGDNPELANALENPKLDLNVNMADPAERDIILKAVRDAYNKTKPCPLLTVDLKVAVRNAQVDLLKDELNGNKDEHKIKNILKNIGVGQKDNKIDEAKSSLVTGDEPITRQKVEEVLNDLEDAALQTALEGNNETNSWSILANKGLVEGRINPDDSIDGFVSEMVDAIKKKKVDNPEFVLTEQALVELRQTAALKSLQTRFDDGSYSKDDFTDCFKSPALGLGDFTWQDTEALYDQLVAVMNELKTSGTPFTMAVFTQKIKPLLIAKRTEDAYRIVSEPGGTPDDLERLLNTPVLAEIASEIPSYMTPQDVFTLFRKQKQIRNNTANADNAANRTTVSTTPFNLAGAFEACVQPPAPTVCQSPWKNYFDVYRRVTYCYREMGPQNKKSYTIACNACRSLNTKLATPHGDAGNTAMFKGSGTQWVGIEFDRSLMTYVYNDGIPVDTNWITWTPWDEEGGHPNNGRDAKDCTVMHDGLLQSVMCTLRFEYICEYQVCESGWTYNMITDRCNKFIGPPMTFEQAQVTCAGRQAIVETARSRLAEDAMMDLGRGACEQSDLWLGMMNIADENTWRWNDGVKAIWTAWENDTSQHGQRKHCAFATYNKHSVYDQRSRTSKWFRSECNSSESKFNVVCGKIQCRHPYRTATSQSHFPHRPECYRCLDVQSINARQAGELCAKDGANTNPAKLAGPKNDTEWNIMLHNKCPGHKWIGLAYDWKDGKWKDNDWIWNQFDSLLGDYLWTSSADVTTGTTCLQMDSDGQWSSATCASNVPVVVCEKRQPYLLSGCGASSEEVSLVPGYYPPVTASQRMKCFYFRTDQIQMTYSEANRFCNSHGGYIVMPKTEGQLKDAFSFITGITYNDGLAWIGADSITHCYNQEICSQNKLPDRFVNLDGSPLGFTNWFADLGEPNNYGGFEDCILCHRNSYHTGDAECWEHHIVVCEVQPNNMKAHRIWDRLTACDGPSWQHGAGDVCYKTTSEVGTFNEYVKACNDMSGGFSNDQTDTAKPRNKNQTRSLELARQPFSVITWIGVEKDFTLMGYSRYTFLSFWMGHGPDGGPVRQGWVPFDATNWENNANLDPGFAIISPTGKWKIPVEEDKYIGVCEKPATPSLSNWGPVQGVPLGDEASKAGRLHAPTRHVIITVITMNIVYWF